MIMRRNPRWHLGAVLVVIVALGLLGRSAPLAASPCTVIVVRDDVPGCAIPGDMDTVLFDLPVGETLIVAGQAVLADGTRWWQVDLPRIDRVWVLPGAVQATGDCDHLPALDPPLTLLTSPCCSSVPGRITPPDGSGSSSTSGTNGGCDE